MDISVFDIIFTRMPDKGAKKANAVASAICIGFFLVLIFPYRLPFRFCKTTHFNMQI